MTPPSSTAASGRVLAGAEGVPRTRARDSDKRGEVRIVYWLIVAQDGFRMRVRTVGGGNTMPVFSRESEASSFLRTAGLEGGWRARETSLGELASLLLGPYTDVSRILLDPLAGEAGPPEGAAGVERRAFVDYLMRGPRAGAAGVGANR
jgi:hypothetical protein